MTERTDQPAAPQVGGVHAQQQGHQQPDDPEPAAADRSAPATAEAPSAADVADAGGVEACGVAEVHARCRPRRWPGVP